MSETAFTVDYFIAKFAAIPEDQWCTGNFESADGLKHCALGHCGEKSCQPNDEGMALRVLLRRTIDINDGKDKRYPQPTPKQRILAALRKIKTRWAA